MSKILKYDELNLINEYRNYELYELNNDKLLEMSNISSEDTGIDNIIIWVEPNPAYHWKRIKVSNFPNSFRINDCFTLTIPDFKIIGKVNTKLITTDVLNKNKTFC